MNAILSPNIFNPMSNWSVGEFFKPVWNHFWTYLNPQTDDPQTHGLSYDLPEETWACIMSELRPYELLKLSTASKKFHLLASDDLLWHRLATKQQLFVKPGDFALHEFKLLSNFQKDHLKWHLAAAIGPSKFQSLIKQFEEERQKKRLESKMPFAYRNFGKDVLKIRCREIASKKEFEMTIIETENSNFVYMNFRNLQLSGGSRHCSVEINQLFLDYLRRLSKGDICGLFLEGKEKLNTAIQLCQ